MGTPEDHLPPSLNTDSIHDLLTSLSLPLPTLIRPLQTSAAFHSIYLLQYSLTHAESLLPARGVDPDGGSMSLVLRVSGRHIPGTKTSNEVAIMRWMRENTSVPVPAVVRWDCTCNNSLGYEFTLLERAEGRSVDDVYSELSENDKRSLVRQLTDVLLEMNRHEWKHIGGLQIDETGNIAPGPVLEDTFWMSPDIEKFWGAGESIKTLNPVGPYTSHAEYIQGFLSCYIHAINSHSSLSWLQALIPRIEALSALVPSLESLSAARLILAHKDLHFANVMIDSDKRITAIIDWEFAGVVPALRWDPVRAFLWSGRYTDEANAEKYRLRGLFEEELQRRGEGRWWDCDHEDALSVWEVLRFVRALVEVCPRGQKADKVEEWRTSAEKALAKLGID